MLVHPQVIERAHVVDELKLESARTISTLSEERQQYLPVIAEWRVVYVSEEEVNRLAVLCGAGDSKIATVRCLSFPE